MIRVLIADDHAIVREGLKRILSATPDIVVADEASDGIEALEKVSRTDCDVALLDISLPGLSGLDILQQLKRDKPPRCRILMLSVFPEQQYAMSALREGAYGYMTKETIPDELVAAIRRVALGRRYVSQVFAEKLAFLMDSESDKPLHETLSHREFRVMRMLACGKAVKEISGELVLSVKTVSTYRTRVLRKMKMSTNADLVRYCIENNLPE